MSQGETVAKSDASENAWERKRLHEPEPASEVSFEGPSEARHSQSEAQEEAPSEQQTPDSGLGINDDALLTLEANCSQGFANYVIDMGGGMLVKIKKHREFFEIEQVDEMNHRNLKRLQLTEAEKTMLRPLIMQALKGSKRRFKPDGQLWVIAEAVLFSKVNEMTAIRSENQMYVQRIFHAIESKNKKDNAADTPQSDAGQEGQTSEEYITTRANEDSVAEPQSASNPIDRDDAQEQLMQQLMDDAGAETASPQLAQKQPESKEHPTEVNENEREEKTGNTGSSSWELDTSQSGQTDAVIDTSMTEPKTSEVDFSEGKSEHYPSTESDLKNGSDLLLDEPLVEHKDPEQNALTQEAEKSSDGPLPSSSDVDPPERTKMMSDEEHAAET